MDEAFALRLFYAVFFTALGVQVPFLPQWLDSQGMEGLRLGLIMAIMPAMGMLGPPLFGLVADASGLRGALLGLCTLSASLVTGGMALAACLGRPLGFWGLWFLLAVFSVFRTSTVTMLDVLAMEHVRRRNTSYGNLRVWGSIGFLLSAVASGRWLNLSGAAAFPAAMSVPLFAAFLLSRSLPSRALGTPSLSWPGVLRLMRSPSFRLFLLACFLVQVAHSNYDLCFSMHLQKLGASGTFVGLAWAVGVACEIVLMFNSASILDRVGVRRVFAFSLAMATLRWVLIGHISNTAILLPLQLLHGPSFALWWLSSLAAVRAEAPPELLGTAQGLFSAAAAAGLVVGLLLWSDLFRLHGGAYTFSYAAWIAAVSCLCAWAWQRSRAT